MKIDRRFEHKAKFKQVELNEKQQAILSRYINLASKSSIQPSYKDLAKYGISKDQVKHHFFSLENLREYALLNSNIESDDSIHDKKREHIAGLVKNLIVDLGYFPALPQLNAAGVTRDTLKSLFGSIDGLRIDCELILGEDFPEVFSSKHFDEKAHESTRSTIKKYKRFIVTSAVVGAKVNQPLLKSIKNYCKRKNAALLVMPIGGNPERLDRCLIDELIVSDVLKLNRNLQLIPIVTSETSQNAANGMERTGRHGTSVIMPLTIQRLDQVPSEGIDKLPHAIMTTGVITDPPKRLGRERLKASIFRASQDQQLSGWFVEIVNDSNYHFRQMPVDDDGSIVDFGVRFNPNGTTETACTESLKPGDWHCGSTDPKVRESVFSIAKSLKPENIHLEDAYDGRSFNTHDDNDFINQILKNKEGKDDLQGEINAFAKEIKLISKLCGKLVINKGNHDEQLDRLARRAHDIFPKRPQIALYLFKLCEAMVQRRDPLEWAVENTGILSKKELRKVKFLRRQVEESQENLLASDGAFWVGCHGDLGANGSRNPNLKSLEKAYGEGVFGHTHSAGQLRRTYRVGTSTTFRLDYNKGPSGWTQTLALIYRPKKKGSRVLVQLINIVDGKYKL